MICCRYKPEDPPSGCKMKVPCCIIWGTQDTALSISMVADSAKWIPDLKVKYIPSAGHWVQQQEPEKVNHYMREFLRKNWIKKSIIVVYVVNFMLFTSLLRLADTLFTAM